MFHTKSPKEYDKFPLKTDVLGIFKQATESSMERRASSL
jgi:hypothetical protein